MNQTQGRFLSVLKEESSILESLHNVLLEEHSALTNRNSDLITELADRKATILEKLGILDKQRQLYTDNKTHFYELNDEKTAFYSHIKALNNEIHDSLDKCKHQNKINGGIIEMSYMFNEKILDIIFGNSEKEATYSAEGKNNLNNTQHSLARV